MLADDSNKPLITGEERLQREEEQDIRDTVELPVRNADASRKNQLLKWCISSIVAGGIYALTYLLLHTAPLLYEFNRHDFTAGSIRMYVSNLSTLAVLWIFFYPLGRLLNVFTGYAFVSPRSRSADFATAYLLVGWLLLGLIFVVAVVRFIIP